MDISILIKDAKEETNNLVWQNSIYIFKMIDTRVEKVAFIVLIHVDA